jgi:hypothetical protein
VLRSFPGVGKVFCTTVLSGVVRNFVFLVPVVDERSGRVQATANYLLNRSDGRSQGRR